MDMLQWHWFSLSDFTDFKLSNNEIIDKDCSRSLMSVTHRKSKPSNNQEKFLFPPSKYVFVLKYPIPFTGVTFLREGARVSYKLS